MDNKDQLLAGYHKQFNQHMDELKEKLEKIESFIAKIKEMNGIAVQSHTTLMNKLEDVKEEGEKNKPSGSPSSSNPSHGSQSSQDGQNEKKDEGKKENGQVFSSLIDKE